MNTPERALNPERVRWLLPMVFLINLLMVRMIVTYSMLNLWPFLPTHESKTLTLVRFVAFHIASLLPTALSFLYLRPITAWVRRVWRQRTEGTPLHVPRAVLERAANVPFLLGIFCLASWLLMDAMLFVRVLAHFSNLTVRRLIEQDPEAPALQKQARDVTVMFLDIEGYTRLSQEIPRQVLSEIVERYFSLFLSDIRAEAGDINETAGDGLMILFQEGGLEAHAAAAARAALAIREKTRAANLEAEAGRPAIAVNIGISSGEGDVGSTRFQGAAGERWTFTATGPVTNLAARLGDLAEHGQILLSPETAARVRGRFRMQNLGPRELKNITPPVEVWEVEDD